MDSEYAKKLLRQTAGTYDDIARIFSQTRQWRQKEIEDLIVSRVGAKDRVLDIGCGNGRFCDPVQKIGAKYTGLDSSKELVKIARGRCPGANFEIGEATDLPFPAETFGAAIAIAVMHHIPSKDLQIKFFYEAHRVMKAGGIFIITAWDLRPDHMIAAGEWKRFRSYLKEQAAIAFRLSKLDFGDFFIPWQNKQRRYVHAFTLDEMRELAVSVGFEIIDSGILKCENSKEQNLYIVCRKAQ